MKKMIYLLISDDIDNAYTGAPQVRTIEGAYIDEHAAQSKQFELNMSCGHAYLGDDTWDYSDDAELYYAVTPVEVMP